MPDSNLLERRLDREIKARREAEAILEAKALELYHTNNELRTSNENLEHNVALRTEQLKASEEKYRGIIENMELGLLEVDNAGIIVRAYPRFCELVSYKENELIGKSAVDILLPPEFIPVLERQSADRAEGKAGVYEIQILNSRKELIWVLISGTPIYSADGEIVGSVGIHYNITYQKELQSQLELAKHQAEHAEQAQKKFLANMSHEIRTPLNAIIGMAHLLYDTRPTPQQVDYLNVLKNSANHLHNLISDILDYSKIDSGNIEIRAKPFDLFGLIRTLQKSFQMKLDGRPIRIEAFVDADIQDQLVGDVVLLNQILMNLLSNAEKFTEKGKIGIRVALLERNIEECLFEFEVYDTGIGIVEENLPLIFQDFQQLDNEYRIKYKGTGLGLAITKKLIELQGGTIGVQSIFGKGTTFTFTLTYKIAQKYTDLPEERLRTKSNHSLDLIAENLLPPNCKVLVVEDNEMNRKYLFGLLDKWHIKYDVAVNGLEAIELAQTKSYSMILMDIQMPIMDGNEATLQIRNTNNPNRNVPIVALTASALLDEKNRSERTGMTDFITKPFSPTQLLEKLNQYLTHEPLNSTHNTNDSNDIFTFDSRLDNNYLLEFYDNDLDYAADMFDTFINVSLKDLYLIPPLVKVEKWDDIAKLAHKLKPTFAMVGLPWLTEKMSLLEYLARTNPVSQEIETLLTEVVEKSETFGPILAQQLERLKNFTTT